MQATPATEPLEATERAVELCTLPFEAQAVIAAYVIPSSGLADSPAAWCDALMLSASSHLLHAALVEAVRERVPIVGDEIGPAAFANQIGSLLRGGGSSKWQPVRPLRAVRAQTNHTAPMHAAPRLSGASLCTVAPQQLCLFGGRASTTGDTLDATCLIKVSSRVAVWDALLAEVRPPARCYHSAAIWVGGPTRTSHKRADDMPPMVVFGGAGAGDERNENLLSDVWMAEIASAAHCAARSLPPPPPLTWRQIHPHGGPPQARSSHICARWPKQRALIFHGGLSADGVLGDTWVLTNNGSGSGDGEWIELNTTGGAVRRAHHSGGLVGESTLLVFSGQDETLITMHTLASLDLLTCIWTTVALPTAGPCWSTRRQASAGSHCGAPVARIDGAGTAIDGVGLLIFGGVGDDFGFVPAIDAWLLRSATDVSPKRRLALPLGTPSSAPTSGSPLSVGPCARACLGLCADGAMAYLFGGFDGNEDLNDLWALDLASASKGFPGGNAAAAANGTTVGGAAARSGRSGRDAFDADIFKVRQARASAVLHATPGAAGHNSIGMPIHVLVGMAAKMPVCTSTEGDVLVPPTPQQGDVVGVSTALSQEQRAGVLMAFRADP